MNVFARVDHAAGAAEVGLNLRPTEVIIFGAFRNHAWRTFMTTTNATTKLFVALAVLSFTAASIGRATIHDDQSRRSDDPNWSELIASMDKMHMAMGAVVRSGNSDVDFVRLMLPHHEAAIEMAKTQLLYGKDPQMRRLAQEIITDQQSEIELMQLWLKQQHAN
jgi:uncharacterized protein (DUF305 family)